MSGRILILQHLTADGPAYLARWLHARGCAVDLRNTEAGDPYPESLAGYAAMAILGGEMSANDPLPALRQAERLFLQAVERGVPTLGHCLGGQLMARALGAVVDRSPAPEVGWQPIAVLPGAASHRWFGDATSAHVFQWHYEAFGLPAGATLLARSAACPHQAFALGPHLGMQFHVEVDDEKLQRWSRDDGERFLAALQSHPLSVQDGRAMRSEAVARLPAQQSIADRIYAHWLAQVAGA